MKKNSVGRPTALVANQRIKEVAAMLLLCKPRAEIIDYCVKNYGIKEVSVANIVTSAYKYIRETHDVDRENLVVLHIQYYYDIYAQAKALGDNRGAIQALNSVEKLLKLVAPDSLTQNNFNFDLSKFTVSELRELIKANI